jgi:hypothetical protein
MPNTAGPATASAANAEALEVRDMATMNTGRSRFAAARARRIFLPLFEAVQSASILAEIIARLCRCA